MYFILERDRLTKDGVRLMTQAVNTTQKKVQNEMDAERKAKQQTESESDEKEDENEAGGDGEGEEQLSTQKKLHKARSKGVRAIEVVCRIQYFHAAKPDHGVVKTFFFTLCYG